MMIASFSNINASVSEGCLLFILFFLYTSAVIADSRLKLNFPEEFYSSHAIDKKFNRDTQSQKKINNDVRVWRKQAADKSSTDSRWKGIESIYVEHKERAPLMLHDGSSAQQIYLEPQFNLRF